MDPDTEKQLAELIMEEAKRLRQQADREGVHVYLAKPNVRERPNSQFLTATVRGVQQANRMAEVNEMWRLREKELELERRSHHSQSSNYQKGAWSNSSRQNLQDRYNAKCQTYSTSKEVKDYRNEFSSSESADSPEMSDSCESNQYYSAKRKIVDKDATDVVDSIRDYQMHANHRDEGLCDEEIELFLRSRAKRGRGAVGSRMDEPGPYLMSHGGKSSPTVPAEARVREDWEQRIIGPNMPSSSSANDALAGLEKVKRKKSRKKESKQKSKRHSKIHSDVDGKSKFKKSKKKHEGNELKKEKKKKDKRKKRGKDE